MLPAKITLLFGFAALLKSSTAAPDSAGMVEMMNGLAYGGIPYGSVSGMLAKYPGYRQTLQARQFDLLSSASTNRLREINYRIRPSFQAWSRNILPRPVRIYNPSRLISPGIIGWVNYSYWSAGRTSPQQSDIQYGQTSNINQSIEFPSFRRDFFSMKNAYYL